MTQPIEPMRSNSMIPPSATPIPPEPTLNPSHTYPDCIAQIGGTEAAATAEAESASSLSFTTQSGLVIPLQSLELTAELTDEAPAPKPKRKRSVKRKAKRSEAPAAADAVAVAEDTGDTPDLAKASPETGGESERVIGAEPALEASDEPEQVNGSAQQILTQLIASVEHPERDLHSSAALEGLRAHRARAEEASKAQQGAGAEIAASSVQGTAGTAVAVAAAGRELSAEEQKRYAQMGLKEGDTCPHCGSGQLLVRHTDHVDFLGCSNFPECKVKIFLGRLSQVVSMRQLSSTCPKCGQPLSVKKGRYGMFIGCSNYPECTYVHKEKGEEVAAVPCPVCHKGMLEPRRARSGRSFWGCNHYPQCSFVLPSTPQESPCPVCGFPLRYQKKGKAGTTFVCGNSLCPSRKKRERKAERS